MENKYRKLTEEERNGSFSANTNEEQKIITVGELIEILEKYPKDKTITYDYCLPIEILELADGSLTIS